MQETTFAERLATARGNLSTRALSRLLGKSAAYVSQVEKRGSCPAPMVEKIAKRLGVQAAWLAYGTGPKRTRSAA